MAGDAGIRTKQAVSAGGVVYRRNGDTIDVLLLETSGGIWGLPKGTPNDGETLAQTALREVREETGLEVACEEKIGTIEYWFVLSEQRERFHKFVHFWLMCPLGGSLDRHDDEHVEVRWYPLQSALKRVTHANTVEILQRAATLLEERDGPAPGGG